MKLKQILSDIKEEFVSGVESYGDYFEIYKNPTLSEIREMKEESEYGGIRFIADKYSRDVYLAPDDVLHDKIQKESGLNVSNYESVLLFGRGELKGKVFEVVQIRLAKKNPLEVIRRVKRDVSEGEYDWLEIYYFDINQVEDKVRDAVEDTEELLD